MPVRIAAAVLFLLAATACRAAPDPLAEHRATCEKLQKGGQLKKDLTVEACAQKLKDAAEVPGRLVEEALSRISSVTAQAHGSSDEAQKRAVREASEALGRLGRVAARPALAKLEASIDPEFRLAVARGLAIACSADCAAKEFSCIVPALLEGAREDKPADVRRDALKGLATCTGQPLGEDPAAWRKWWAEHKQGDASQAAR